jgi:GntR family transcriptional regulator
MPRDAVPPYRRVAAALREQIESGALLPGEQVPPVPRLCETYGVSRNTALRALRVLRDDGLIKVEPGWGAFVADSSNS